MKFIIKSAIVALTVVVLTDVAILAIAIKMSS